VRRRDRRKLQKAVQDIRMKEQLEEIYLCVEVPQKPEQEQDIGHEQGKRLQIRDAAIIQRLTPVFQEASQAQILLDFYQMVSIQASLGVTTSRWCHPLAQWHLHIIYIHSALRQLA
jgi:hypothetical protein